MISIYLGNVGSGKTAMAVREMAKNKTGIPTFSNIKTKLKHQFDLNPEMIIKKEMIKTKKTGEAVYDYKLNVEFWQNIPKPLNVVLDEAHSILNSRRSMQKANILITDWLALIRRVIGSVGGVQGELIFITQLPNRIDVIAREMATQVRYHVCYYQKTCKKCGMSWNETSEQPEPLWNCPSCRSIQILKHSHKVEVWHFDSIFSYTSWRDGFNPKGFYKNYIVTDIEDYFGLFDTYQWDNMFSSLE